MGFWNDYITRKMEKQGYSRYYAYKIFEARFDDMFKNNLTSIKQKLWAQNRGFYSYKINYYKLTDENHTNYLPDFEYYRLHPINGNFSHWIDDKLIIRLILHPFVEYLPDYYYQILDDEIFRLPDCPAKFSNTIDDIFSLLIQKKSLAAKKFAGSKGHGFYKLSYKNHNYFINDKQLSERELENQFQEWKEIRFGGYLLTEYLKPCNKLSEIWERTPNTLRISVIRKKYGKPEIIAAYIRFGTEKSGVVDNASSGGVGCRIDLSDGSFTHGVVFNDKKIRICTRHPDTHIPLEGVIPHWSLIKNKIIEISSYIPQVIYQGYDIVVTEHGFKIIEINSHEGIAFNQAHTPYLGNEQTKDFFVPLLDNKKQQLGGRKSRRFFKKIIDLMKTIKWKIAQALKSEHSLLGK